MDRPIVLLLLVLSSIGCVLGEPRITVVNDDAHHAHLTETERPTGDATTEFEVEPGSDVMQSLLNWGIKHSDPERLKELMQKYKDQNLTITDVYGKDVIDALFVNEGSVMKDMVLQIADFRNASVADDDLEDALNRLQELVEQVDNGGNLHGMGGLRPLLDLGCSGPVVVSYPVIVERSESVRALALWTLGVAVQNNPPVQADLMDMGGLAALLSRLRPCTGNKVVDAPEHIPDSSSSEYCTKLLFAISGLIKNNETLQATADDQGLFDWLLDIGISHHLPSIVKKSLGLLEIALSQSPDLGFLGRLPAKQDAVATSLLAHLEPLNSDIDAADKALRLINRLLSLRPMLFRPSFRSEFAKAVASVIKNCEQVHGAGEELCDDLDSLAKQADLALAARELSDDEL